MPNFVQEYRSTDVGMPVLSGTAGALIALLDAVLVNGGATQTVTGIVESGTTYTATIPADASLETGDNLTIAGATPAGANGIVQITVPDSTHFSYQGPGGLGAITGSITYRRTPLGWTKPYTGTNLAAFRSQAGITGRPQMYVRLDETGATAGGQKECAVRGYMAMVDINPGTDPFPTVAQMPNGVCWRKSTTADATARPWVLVGDGSTFYFIPNSDNSNILGRGLVGCGTFVSFKVPDAYNCFCSGNGTFNVTTNSLTFNTTGSGINCVAPVTLSLTTGNACFAARSYSQVGGAVYACSISYLAGTAGAIGVPVNREITYPNGADGGLWVCPILLTDSNSGTIIRGRLLGVYDHGHANLPFSEFDTATNVVGLPGAKLRAYTVTDASGGGRTGQALLDIAGPWV